MALPPILNSVKQTDPELYRLVSELNDLAFTPGALDRKTKILMALALDAFKGAEQGVAVLSSMARETGASEQEIAEALRMAYFVSGMDSIITGTAAFRK